MTASETYTIGAETVIPSDAMISVSGLTTTGEEQINLRIDNTQVSFVDRFTTIAENSTLRSTDGIVVFDTEELQPQRTQAIFDFSSIEAGAEVIIYRGTTTSVLFQETLTANTILRYTDADGEEVPLGFTRESPIARDYLITISHPTAQSVLDLHTVLPNTAQNDVPQVQSIYTAAAQQDESANIALSADVTGRAIQVQAYDATNTRIPFDIDGCTIDDRPSEAQCNRLFSLARGQREYLRGLRFVAPLPTVDGQRVRYDVMQLVGGNSVNLRRGEYHLTNPEVGEGQQWVSGVYEATGLDFTPLDEANAVQLSTDNFTDKNPDVVGQLRRIGVTPTSIDTTTIEQTATLTGLIEQVYDVANDTNRTEFTGTFPDNLN